MQKNNFIIYASVIEQKEVIEANRIEKVYKMPQRSKMTACYL